MSKEELQVKIDNIDAWVNDPAVKVWDVAPTNVPNVYISKLPVKKGMIKHQASMVVKHEKAFKGTHFTNMDKFTLIVEALADETTPDVLKAVVNYNNGTKNPETMESIKAEFNF